MGGEHHFLFGEIMSWISSRLVSFDCRRRASAVKSDKSQKPSSSGPQTNSISDVECTGTKRLLAKMGSNICIYISSLGGYILTG
jgi:hypothetical protein